jgi:hypothetical protein
MADSKRPVYLRPEAQPVSAWSQLTEHQKNALEHLANMLYEASLRTSQDTRSNKELPWLFNETRTQLAFVNGKRGTGKTTLMTTLASGIAQPTSFREAEKKDAKPADTAEDSHAQFERVHRLFEQLHGCVVCVQPLEMEGLPDNTPLMAAILARIQRAVEASRNARATAGNDREQIRFRQYLVRVSQSLDSNLPHRRGQLDPEQYGQAVFDEEQKRLQMPSDLDEVLRQLSERVHPSAQGAQGSRKGRRPLFLVPIDDVDLNPKRCMELLRVLRTYSPPRELFFLLMGQFELVEHIVEQSMTADFRGIK